MTTTISDAGAHGTAEATDRVPASKSGAKGYHSLETIKDYVLDGLDPGDLPVMVSTGKLLGRQSPGTGPVEEIAISDFATNADAFIKATDTSNDVSYKYAGTGSTRTVRSKIDNDLGVSPADFGGDIEDMFASGATKFYVPADDYEFDAKFTIPAGALVRCEDGAIFRPTFEATSTARADPYITLGEGVDINLLDVRLVEGIDTVRKLVATSGGARIGKFIAKSVDLNNNRTESGSTDLISAALLLSGNYNWIGTADVDRFDAAIQFNETTGSRIDFARVTETVRGINAYKSTYCQMIRSHISGPIDPTEPNGFVNARGIMTPGANGLLLSGARFCDWGNLDIFETLEHGVRVGAGVDTFYNEHNAFGTVRIIRPYGCGFKADDGDAFTIQHVRINQLYTEDVGNGNWFGTGGYTNWQSGSVDNPALDNDGNKQGCAIRNTRHARLLSFENRTVSQSESGYMGLWIERSQDVIAVAPDTSATRSHGVCVQTGGPGDLEKVYVVAPKVRSALGNGVHVAVPNDTGDIRGLSITDCDVYGCTGYGAVVEARPNTNSPFAPTYGASIISGRFAGNTAGVKSIAASVIADADFIDGINPPRFTDGGLLIGADTPSTLDFSAVPAVQVHSTSAGAGTLAARWANSASGAQMTLAKSRGGVGTQTVVQSGDTIGTLAFEASDGTSFQRAAAIVGTVGGTPGSSDMPGRLSLQVTPDGAHAPVEAMRIEPDRTPVFHPPATAASLGTNGHVTFELTDNTTLTFKARGADGTTRSGTLTLA